MIGVAAIGVPTGVPTGVAAGVADVLPPVDGEVLASQDGAIAAAQPQAAAIGMAANVADDQLASDVAEAAPAGEAWSAAVESEPQAEPVTAAPVAEPAPAIAAVAAPAPAPVVVPPSELSTQDLQAVAQTAGLEWVHTDADKVREVQEAMAREPKPAHVPREPKPVVAVDEGPLVLVETRRDLSQVKLPFEADNAPRV